MSSVDNRVVQMGFDNQQFETGVKTTVGSLETLKKSLNLDESAKSLSNLSDASKRFSLEGISAGVQNVSSKFSALGVIGFTVLQNLTNAAIDFGRKMVDNMVVPMRTGFQEYETQMNAVQTILANTASKGTNLEQVNSALDELNTYADKTIYNFTEMTRNIGTFTAAGVDLDTSVSAIKGIANLAAVSGSSALQASTGMYQLSQAISSGTVRLQDWNSVQNAGMGGEVFRNSLLETARVHGVAVDDIIKKEGSFRESLSKGWLSSEILLETLSKFTGDLTKDQLVSMGYTEEQIAGILKLGETANDAATKVKTLTQLQDTLAEAKQSGWAQSWRIIVGDFEEAKALFTEVSDIFGAMINESANARNEVLQAWSDMGGRQLLIISLRNAFKGVMGVVAPIKEAFREIFPAVTAKDLFNLTAMLVRFTDKLKMSGETANKIKIVFKGIFAIFDILRMAVVALLGTFLNFGKSLNISGSGILNFLTRIAAYILDIRYAIKTTDAFNVAIQRIKEVLIKVKNAVVAFSKEVWKRFEGIRTWLADTFGGLFKDIKIDTSGITKFFDNLKIRLEPLGILGKGVMLILGGLIKLAEFVAPILLKVGTIVANFAKGIAEKISDAIKNLDLRKLFTLINGGLIGSLIIAIRKFVDSGGGALENAGGIFSGITEILDGVRGALEAWQKNLEAKTLLTIAIAIGILAASLVAISLIDSDKLTGALIALTAMFVEMISAQSALNKIGGKSSAGASAALVGLAAAALIMSFAVSNLAKIDPDDVGQGLGAILALSAGLVAVSRLMDKNSGTILKGAVGFTVFAGALYLLVGVIKRLGALDPTQVTNGLVALGALLAELGIFTRISKLDKMGVTKGVGLVALAGSIMLMSYAIEKFGNMDPTKLEQGLVAIGAVLGELGIFTRLTGDGKRIISTAVGVTIIAGAMLIFTEAVTRMGNLSLDQIARGLGTMAGVLAIIFATVKLMPKSIFLTGPALVAISIALLILSKSLSNLGNMSWEGIGKGLAALAGSMAILITTLYAMQGTLMGSAALLIATTALIALSVAMKALGSMQLGEIGLALGALAGALIILGVAGYLLTPVVPVLLGLGVAMVLVGVAVAAVGVGLLAFSAGLAALAVTGVAGAVAITAMIATILGVVPLIIQTLIDAIVLFNLGIIEAAPVIGLAFETMLLTMLNSVIKVAPKLFEAITVMVKGIYQVIRDTVPDFIDTVAFLLTELLKSIAARAPDFVQSGLDILISFLEGIRDNIFEIVTVAIEIVTNFIDGVASQLPNIIDSGFNLIVQFINGLADGIEKNGPEMQAAIGNLTQAIIDGFCNGILAGTRSVISAIGSLAGAAVSALKTLLGIFSPSRVFTDLGTSVPLGFVKGILKFGEKVANATERLGKKAIDGMETALSFISDSLNDNLDISPTIRPVVDLSEIVTGGKAIDSLLNTKKTINVIPTTNRASNIASSFPFGFDPGTALVPVAQPTVSFIQNNYSPKALSRIEIYRQTKNQLLTLKGLVKA